ncbi:hypothetical protein MNBD_ALPHA04-2364, partial [hydrothermal vent metagenome]
MARHSKPANAKPANGNGARSDERPKSRNVKPIKALLPFISPHKGLVIGALIALVLAASMTLTLPTAFRRMIDNGFVGEN